MKNRKRFICSINRNHTAIGWFVFVIGYYDSLNIPTQHFGGINQGFAIVIEFWMPVLFKAFGKNNEAIQTAVDLEKDITEQAELLGNQLKEQEAKREQLRSNRK